MRLLSVDRTELTLSMRRRPTWTLTKNQRRLWNVCAFLLVIAAVMTPGGLISGIAIVLAIAIVEKRFIRPTD